MRLLVLSHMYPRSTDPAGGTFVHRHVQALASLGVEIEVLAPVPWVPPGLGRRDPWRHYLAPYREMWDGVPVTRPRYLRPPGKWFHGWSGVSLYQALRTELRSIRQRFPFDLIHSHMLVPDGLAGGWLARDCGVPSVCTVRGDDVNIAPYWNKTAKRASEAAIRATGQIVSVSWGLAEAMEPIGRPQRPVKVVYTGTDFRLDTQGQRETIRLELGLSPDQVLLLEVGALYRNKGQFELLAALAALLREGHRVHLALIGSGPHEADLRTLAAKFGLDAHVSFHGQQPHAEVMRFMTAADVVVLPSYNEGLPNALVEAHGCGRAVVATRVGGIPEVVRDGVSGVLCPPQDSVALTRALRLLVTDPALRQRMGAAGQAWVAEHFTWAQNAWHYLQIYQDLIGK